MANKLVTFCINCFMLLLHLHSYIGVAVVDIAFVVRTYVVLMALIMMFSESANMCYNKLMQLQLIQKYMCV